MTKAISITFAVLSIVFLTSMVMNHSFTWPSQKDGVAGKPGFFRCDENS
jgi:hypothetical protein